MDDDDDDDERVGRAHARDGVPLHILTQLNKCAKREGQSTNTRGQSPTEPRRRFEANARNHRALIVRANRPSVTARADAERQHRRVGATPAAAARGAGPRAHASTPVGCKKRRADGPGMSGGMARMVGDGAVDFLRGRQPCSRQEEGRGNRQWPAQPTNTLSLPVSQP